MSANLPYNANLAAEQFFFYELRIVGKRYLEGMPVKDIIKYVKKDNLFQYPTERRISRSVLACHRRIIALGNDKLVYEVVNAPAEIAKQINLYAMMRYQRLVREFMERLVGEKYRQLDLSYTRKDINIFFTHIQEQNDNVALWSEITVAKLKQVLTRCLIETKMLDSFRDTTLNPIMISKKLETGIRENNDLTALAAFNCFNQELDNGRHQTRA
jgi:hypothetical protein